MFLSVHLPLRNTVTIHINSCKLYGGTSISKGGGFMLHIDSDDNLDYHYFQFVDYQGHLSVYLANLELYNNSAANGSAIYFRVLKMGILQMSQVCSSFISVDAMTTLANMGQECMCIFCLYGDATPIILTLNHSMFVQNAANLGQTEVYIHYPLDPELFQMTIASTIFHRNFMLVRNYPRCDMAAVCLSSVYLDPGWIYDMFK